MTIVLLLYFFLNFFHAPLSDGTGRGSACVWNGAPLKSARWDTCVQCFCDDIKEIIIIIKKKTHCRLFSERFHRAIVPPVIYPVFCIFSFFYFYFCQILITCDHVLRALMFQKKTNKKVTQHHNEDAISRSDSRTAALKNKTKQLTLLLGVVQFPRHYLKPAHATWGIVNFFLNTKPPAERTVWIKVKDEPKLVTTTNHIVFCYFFFILFYVVFYFFEAPALFLLLPFNTWTKKKTHKMAPLHVIETVIASMLRRE